MNKIEQRLFEIAERKNKERGENIDKTRELLNFWSKKINAKEALYLTIDEYRLMERQLITCISHCRELKHSNAQPFVAIQGRPTLQAALNEHLDTATDLLGGYLLRVQKLIEREESATKNGAKRKVLVSKLKELHRFKNLSHRAQSDILDFLCNPRNLPKKIAYCFELGMIDSLFSTRKTREEVYKILAKYLNDGKNKDDIKKHINAYENPNSPFRYSHTAHEFKDGIKQELST